MQKSPALKNVRLDYRSWEVFLIFIDTWQKFIAAQGIDPDTIYDHISNVKNCL